MREEEIARGARAIRASWRMEMQPQEAETASRLLAGLPGREAETGPAQRLAAAGHELLDLRQLVGRTRAMVQEGELPLGSPAEQSVLDDVLRGVAELVARIEAQFGAFPKPDASSRKTGVRHTYLVDVDEEHHASARWIVDLGHQASDAPEPNELVGRMTLRAIAADLREVERFLVEMASALEPDSLRDLTVETQIGCGELAGALETVLPPAPLVPTPNGDHVESEAER
jgi:hypothetical protein